MPTFEISKLQGISAPRALSESDRAQLANRSFEQVANPAAGEPKPGVSLEVEATAAPDRAPIDSERVAEIRAALKDGSYPLVPTEIADAMIAAREGFGIV